MYFSFFTVFRPNSLNSLHYDLCYYFRYIYKTLHVRVYKIACMVFSH